MMISKSQEYSETSAKSRLKIISKVRLLLTNKLEVSNVSQQLNQEILLLRSLLLQPSRKLKQLRTSRLLNSSQQPMTTPRENSRYVKQVQAHHVLDSRQIATSIIGMQSRKNCHQHSSKWCLKRHSNPTTLVKIRENCHRTLCSHLSIYHRGS